MKMQISLLEKMSKEKLNEHLKTAENFIKELYNE